MDGQDGIFARNVEAYAAAGLPVFPVNTRHKKPAVRGWQNASPRRARAWASVETLGNSDGLGIVMGRPSGLTEIDVDAVGDAWLALAMERFGETPVVIQTASGKAKLWYRHAGEGRRIRPIDGWPIDVLGGGFTIAPPSWREDLASAYAYRSGSIGDLDRLPAIRTEALDASDFRMSQDVRPGQRNDALWRHCMVQARHCDDVEALIDVAATWNAACPVPLGAVEVQRCGRSAWKYEASGRNFLGLKKPQVTDADRVMDNLLDAPDAYMLLQMFFRWHSGRPSFAIAPTAMSAAGSPPWPRRRIEKARDILLARGHVVEIAAPLRGQSGSYRLRQHIGRSANNHYTPFSRPLTS